MTDSVQDQWRRFLNRSQPAAKWEDVAKSDEHRFLIVKHIIVPSYAVTKRSVEFVFVQNLDYYEKVYGRKFVEPIARFQFPKGTVFPVFPSAMLTDALLWAQKNCIERLPFQLFPG